MNILVLNCGSSSIKSALFSDESNVLSVTIERIGFSDSIITYKIPTQNVEEKFVQQVPNHKTGIEIILTSILPKTEIKKIDGIGHRVAHGGERFTTAVIVDEYVKQEIEKCIPLAPLHNPHNLAGIVACETLLPEIKNVAVFDTSFHQTMPMKAALFPIPYSLYEKYKIRRYGFHGTSHQYLVYRAAEILKTKPEKLKLITCHLGNGASIAAIKYAKSIDTTMGFTPTAGIMMGTRSGDIDPGVVTFLQSAEGLSPQETNLLFNNRSGLLGVSGVSSDMRTIIDLMNRGDKKAELAFEMYCYITKKYISQYIGVLNYPDAIIFSAGVGENSPLVREHILQDMDKLGIIIDKKLNNMLISKDGIISKKESRIKVLVIKTNEELMIAKITKKLLSSEAGNL